MLSHFFFFSLAPHKLSPYNPCFAKGKKDKKIRGLLKLSLLLTFLLSKDRPGKTKANEVEAVSGGIVAAIGNPAIPGTIDPRPTAQHPVQIQIWAPEDLSRAPAGYSPFQSATPLPDISRHIDKVLAHWACVFPQDGFYALNFPLYQPTSFKFLLPA